MTSTAGVPNNVVRVGLLEANAISAEKAKFRLEEGVPQVTIAALNLFSSFAVIFSQMLRDQSMVKITSIYTQGGAISVDEQRSGACDQIEIKVVKTSDFDAIYAEQARVSTERRAAREVAMAETVESCEALEAEELD